LELAGVTSVDVNLATDEFTVTYDASVVNTGRMNEAIVELGYRPTIVQSRIDVGASTSRSGGPMHEPLVSALREAGETSKLVFVDFYAEWCGACKTMDRTTFKDRAVAKALEGFVFIKVDADRHPDAARHFNVVGLPTLVVLEASGEEIYRRVGPIEAGELARELSSLPGKDRTIQRRTAVVE